MNVECDPTVRDANPAPRYQFERLGYSWLEKDAGPERLVFNRTIAIKDSWAKEVQKG
ncbi:MAG: hypothetical protein HYY24_07100 [Verrucomicrobia bacterium]|nr:hypothetical protein [Verrucomicrobiota bacterium]